MRGELKTLRNVSEKLAVRIIHLGKLSSHSNDSSFNQTKNNYASKASYPPTRY